MTVVSFSDVQDAVNDSRLSPEDRACLSSASEIIDAARNGHMFILVDDEDRENEGDLIIPAQMATPEIVNFMATHGRGLICLAMERPMVEQLGLSMMVKRNTSSHATPFTVSIEAKEGVSTGISAPDRARTVQVAIDPHATADDIATPGHIFPLQANDGGVLVRAGHTEASVDIARMAGLRPAGLICEIMNEDGSMARLPDLVSFAQKHNFKIGTIADLIAFRLQNEKLVERGTEQTIQSKHGGTWRMVSYRNRLNDDEAFALIKGEPTKDTPTLVRMHAMNVMHDVLGVGDSTLHHAMETIAQEEAGVIVVLKGMMIPDDTARKDDTQKTLRSYGIGAQILCDLGVQDMTLLTSSTKHVIGLHGFGLNIVEQRSL